MDKEKVRKIGLKYYDNDFFKMEPPSRVCSICNKFEHPESIWGKEETWICPECASRIKRMIYPEADE